MKVPHFCDKKQTDFGDSLVPIFQHSGLQTLEGWIGGMMEV